MYAILSPLHMLESSTNTVYRIAISPKLCYCLRCLRVITGGAPNAMFPLLYSDVYPCNPKPLSPADPPSYLVRRGD
jgi:hypothetical protein